MACLHYIHDLIWTEPAQPKLNCLTKPSVRPQSKSMLKLCKGMCMDIHKILHIPHDITFLHIKPCCTTASGQGTRLSFFIRSFKYFNNLYPSHEHTYLLH